jgi:hypothetical protein
MADFSSVVRKALPWIGAAATGNVPALIAMAAQTVSDVLGVDVPADGVSITTAVANATPDQLLTLRSREMDFKERMQALGFQQERDLRTLDLEETKALIADASSARSVFGSNDNVFVMGVVILITFASVMAMVLVGLFLLMSGRVTVDAGTLAVCAGLIGTIVGALAANAQQVVSFFYGSSKGSKDSGDRIGQALSDSIRGQAAATDTLASKVNPA